MRFDTTNPPGAERDCVEWVDGVLGGALDMKGGAAMFVAAVLRAVATGMQPAGHVVLALPADEDERVPVEALEFGTNAVYRVLERYGR